MDDQTRNTPSPDSSPQTDAAPSSQHGPSSASSETLSEETNETWEAFIEQTSDEPPRASFEPAKPEKPSLQPHVVAKPQQTPPPSSAADPSKPLPKPSTTPDIVPPSTLSPTMRAVFITVFALAGFVALFALLFRFRPIHGSAVAASTENDTPAAASSAKKKKLQPAHTVLDALPDFETTGIRLPGPWRVSELEGKPGIRVIRGKVGRQPLVKSLTKKGVSASALYRVLHALHAYSRVQRPRRRDEYVVALNTKTKEIVGFELITSPLDIYQARRNDQGELEGTKLDLKITHREVLAGVRIGPDGVEASLRRAHLDPSAAKVIDRAFDRRASVSSMPEDSTLRVILQETRALGRFARYEYVSAMEYRSSKSGKKPLRIYRFQEGKRFAYLDQRGHEPYRGGWRIPVPGAPITSPFNPKRMHPVLHIIRPHNGTDFGAPTGTPVHATSFGVVDWAAPRGAAGNLVIIKHPGNIESYYMHLHHFAPGIKKGAKVETFQVIGYVGTTGRSTGPHLHFGIKKNGKWIDPMSLKLDGDRLLPAAYRPRFEEEKAKWDAKLDSIPIPPPLSKEEPAEEHEQGGEPAEDEKAQNEKDEKANKDKTKETSDQAAEEKKTSNESSQEEDDEELEPEGSEDEEPDDETP